MDALFPLSDTQALMQDSLSRWLQDHAPFERRAGLLATPEAITPLWTGLTQSLGLLGAALPEESGGLGGGLADHLVILQALGHALLPEPYAACVVTGAGLLQRLPGERPRQLLAGVADGTVRPVLAALEPSARHDLSQVSTTVRSVDGASWLSGRKAVVRAAPYATHWLVSARDEAGTLRLALVRPDASGISRRDLRLADGGWAAELAFDATPAEALLGDAGTDLLPLLLQAADEALLAAGAEAVGVMQRLMHDTLDYVRQRKQFGTAIANFQVLQHRMVDMFMNVEQSVSMTYMATLKLDESDAERAKAVSAAKVQIGKACKFVGQNAIQIHGGMGMTDELAVGHYFKRATMIEGLFGSVDHHLRRYETLSFGKAA